VNQPVEPASEDNVIVNLIPACRIPYIFIDDAIPDDVVISEQLDTMTPSIGDSTDTPHSATASIHPDRALMVSSMGRLVTLSY
jgi:hypothetical protein